MRDLIRTATSRRRQFKAVALALGMLPATGAFAQNAAAAESGMVSIPLVARTQMPQGDVQAVSDNQAAISTSAAIYGYALDSGYDYSEIVCPLAPNHILLTYESAQPNGEASRFTAVVPRMSGRTGGVQIISISHFGTVPYLPAGSNPHTIDVFNRVMAAAPVGQAVADNPRSNPLLYSSLCYLAMIGEPPAALTTPSLTPATVHAPVPTMKFREKGSVTQVVSVRNSSDTYQVWNFTFGRDGRLLSAEKVEHPIDTTPPILNAGAPSSPGLPPASAEVSSTPVVAPMASPTVATASSAPATPAVAPAPVAENPAPASPKVTASTPESIAPPTASAPLVATAPVPVTSAAAPATVTPATMAPASAAAAAPFVAEPAKPVVETSAGEATSRPIAPAAAVMASAKPPVPAKVVPRPPERLIMNLPLPHSRIIPDGSLPYPPQAPAK